MITWSGGWRPAGLDRGRFVRCALKGKEGKKRLGTTRIRNEQSPTAKMKRMRNIKKNKNKNKKKSLLPRKCEKSRLLPPHSTASMHWP